MYVERTIDVEIVAPVEEPRYEFPELIDAVGNYFNGEDAKWVIGDLLLMHCGPPGQPGRKNGAANKIKRVRQELISVYGERADRGFPYFEQFRLIAYHFPPPKRFGGLEYSYHLIAGDPETLAAAEAKAKELEVPLTANFIRKFKAARSRPKVTPWASVWNEVPSTAADLKGRIEWCLQNRAIMTAADREIWAVDHPQVRDQLTSALALLDELT